MTDLLVSVGGKRYVVKEWSLVFDKYIPNMHVAILPDTKVQVISEPCGIQDISVKMQKWEENNEQIDLKNSMLSKEEKRDKDIKLPRRYESTGIDTRKYPSDSIEYDEQYRLLGRSKYKNKQKKNRKFPRGHWCNASMQNNSPRVPYWKGKEQPDHVCPPEKYYISHNGRRRHIFEVMQEYGMPTPTEDEVNARCGFKKMVDNESTDRSDDHILRVSSISDLFSFPKQFDESEV